MACSLKLRTFIRNLRAVHSNHFLMRELFFSHARTIPRIGKRSVTTTSPYAFEQVDASAVVEEETLPNYRAERYCPIYIGQMLDNRYKVIGKLGYGSASTVWLCRDSHTSGQFAVVKVYINCSKVHRELPIYEHINSLHSEHQGSDRVRKLINHFKVQGPHGTHICLVHPPFGISLEEIKDRLPGGVVTTAIIRETFRWIIRGLEFLHQEANVIHTDLQASNILLGAESDAIFEKFEKYEADFPVPRKELSDRTIYISRPVPLSSGLPAISDLSEARFGGRDNTGDIMPDIYRAPEVILGLPWSYSVDIWGLGMVIWDLFEGTRVFTARNPENQYSERYHLAEMVAILGPPPLDLIQKSGSSARFWDRDGKWVADVPIPDISLETAEHRLDGEQKQLFLAFIRKMLQWRPEDRASCRDIFFDEWLLGDLIEAGVLEPPPRNR